MQAQGENGRFQKRIEVAEANSTVSTSRMIEQYLACGLLGLLQGDLGYSFEFELPVVRGYRQTGFWLYGFCWSIPHDHRCSPTSWPFPIGIYSAVRQYSIGDYAA